MTRLPEDHGRFVGDKYLFNEPFEISTGPSGTDTVTMKEIDFSTYVSEDDIPVYDVIHALLNPGREPYTVPWTPDEVKRMTLRQCLKNKHPYTCNGGMPANQHRHDHEVILVPTTDGLHCPECGRYQTWVIE